MCCLIMKEIGTMNFEKEKAVAAYFKGADWHSQK
jgi:hypothetical protein